MHIWIPYPQVSNFQDPPQWYQSPTYCTCSLSAAYVFQFINNTPEVTGLTVLEQFTFGTQCVREATCTLRGTQPQDCKCPSLFYNM